MLIALKTDFIRNQQLLHVTKFKFLYFFCDYDLVDLSCNLEMYALNSYKFKNTATLGVDFPRVRVWYASFHCAEGPISSHYNDVIMDAIASQITSLTIVYSTVYSDADQRKHQSSASLAFVRGIHRWPVNSPHKWPVTRKNVSIWWCHHGAVPSIFTFDEIFISLSSKGTGAEF